MRIQKPFFYRLCRKFFFCKKLSAKNQFKSITGLYLNDFIGELNSDLQNVLNRKVESQITFYGGFNNLFFVQHFLDGKLKFITKVAPTKLTLRERSFFDWQQKNISSVDCIAPNMLLYKELKVGSMSSLTMECLSLPKEYRPDAIIELYNRMGRLSESLPTFPGVKKVGNILQFEFEAKTKITSIIKYIVTQLHDPQAYIAAADFMDARSDIFESRKDEFEELKNFLLDSQFIKHKLDFEKHYGFLHGDFKRSNILSDTDDDLKVIDMQYYNYGARLWDMAFYCSKEKDGFEESYMKFILPLELDEIELRIFVFFYILAALLHVKKSNLKKMLCLKAFPAIESLNIQQPLTR